MPCRGVAIPRLHELIAIDPRYLSRLDPGCANGQPQAVPLSESLRINRLVRECPHRGKPGCGCSGSVHCSRLGRDVTHRECFGCVKGGMNAPT